MYDIINWSFGSLLQWGTAKTNENWKMSMDYSCLNASWSCYEIKNLLICKQQSFLLSFISSSLRIRLIFKPTIPFNCSLAKGSRVQNNLCYTLGVPGSFPSYSARKHFNINGPIIPFGFIPKKLCPSSLLPGSVYLGSHTGANFITLKEFISFS